jgi:hypothetical protein
MYKKDPGAISLLTYNPEKVEIDFPDEIVLEIGDRDDVVTLVRNYSFIYNHIKNNISKEETEKFARDFQWSTCNPTLTKQLLGTSFDMKDSDFSDCQNSSRHKLRKRSLP